MNNFLAVLSVVIISLFISSGCEDVGNKNDVLKKSESEEVRDDIDNKPEFVLETLFFYTLSELELKFGKQNIHNRFNKACETCGPEGTPTYENSYTTILFPNTNNEVHIHWDSRQKKVEWISLYNDSSSHWITKEGFKLGDSISKINNYFKNQPFDVIYENIWYLSINNHYSLNFITEDDDAHSCYPCMSTDKALKNLVLTGVYIERP